MCINVSCQITRATDSYTYNKEGNELHEIQISLLPVMKQIGIMAGTSIVLSLYGGDTLHSSGGGVRSRASIINFV